MPSIDAATLPAQIGPRRYAIAVVVDVLRATTTIASMLDSGAVGVAPVAELDDARRLKAGSRGLLLAGERGGLAPEGFDLGNSPGPERLSMVRGREVVLSTTNGTRAVARSRGSAGGVAALSLTNLDAVVGWLGRRRGDVIVVCSGTDGSRSLEDEVAGGMLVASLGALGWNRTERARDLAESAALSLGDAGGVGGAVRASPHACRLIGMGFEDDVVFCSRLSVTRTVPVLVERDGGAAWFVAS